MWDSDHVACDILTNRHVTITESYPVCISESNPGTIFVKVTAIHIAQGSFCQSKMKRVEEEKDLEHQITEGLSAQAITRDRGNVI